MYKFYDIYIYYTTSIHLLEKLASCLKKKDLNCAYKKFVTKNYVYGICELEN